ncbi:MAG: 16S rRNA (guanine(966)-N(2))-methyltransferase RsmD [Bacteroidetes bacterium]|nr:16S rRNA (guanine(966)-N(2))-methyltransferase RsmD [Bacteroidota bacterium]
MRIIAGQRRGMVLASFDSENIRPTKDIVKEFIFNCLATRVDISACSTCDLFAGTGALGIEALSRGAPEVTFVDLDKGAIDLINKNLTKARLPGSSTVVQQDVFHFLKSCTSAFDLVLADPPYGEKRMDLLLTRLEGYVKGGGIAVIEGPSDEPLTLSSSSWTLIKRRAWGESMVTIAERSVYQS